MNISPDDSNAEVSLWFQTKVRENYRLFYSIAARINPREAEDIVQDAILKAWKSLGELQNPEALVGWVARITHNLGLDRKKRRTPELAEQAALEQLHSPSTSGVRTMDDRDDRSAILREMDELPETQAVVLSLRFFEELDIDQIAARLNLTENNVRVRLHRGLENLRQQPRLREMLRAST